ncbi:MAG TPA: hypothetical protein EYQ50_06035 [Verrucomicrobiales bacterium]|nr:hypothetical protein [Verrucomicrobiales bacterium]
MQISQFSVTFMALSVGLVLSTLIANAETIAFSGAEGYGLFARGGRGGDVYIVTHLGGDGKYMDSSQAEWELPGELVIGADKPLTHSASDAYDLVLLNAVASISRDACDDRIINEVKTSTGKIPDSQDEIGGWSTLNSLPAPTDSDKDGMSDVWESANGLNSNSGSDRNDYDLDPNYTNLEVYINGLISKE